jgi:hypothetical protein
LRETGCYNDWVVTTAFYSGIHFLEAHLFTDILTYGTRDLRNLDEAHKFLKFESRHATRRHLVSKFLSTIDGDYSWLESQSRNARYKNYKVQDKIAETACKCLSNIKNLCYKEDAV